jgi:hypothetical protein
MNIKINEAMNVTIVNSIGQLLSQNQLAPGYNSLPIQHLTSGAYILQFHNTKGTHQTLIIKE